MLSDIKSMQKLTTALSHQVCIRFVSGTSGHFGSSCSRRISLVFSWQPKHFVRASNRMSVRKDIEHLSDIGSQFGKEHFESWIEKL
jgi:hypothetical protein